MEKHRVVATEGPLSAPSIGGAGLRPNQPVYLVWRTGGDQPTSLKCWLWTTHPEHMTLIIDGERPAPSALPIGQEIELEFPTVAGTARAVGRLERYVWPQGGLVIRLNGPVSIQEQRRFPRIMVTLPPVPAAVVTTGQSNRPVFTVRIADLSAGGVRFLSPLPLNPCEQLRLELTIDGGPAIPAVVSILACAPAAGQPGSHIARGSFAIIKNDDQERIATFVVRKQVAELHTFV